MKINPYLFINDHKAFEALDFYCRVLGAERGFVQTMGEAPFPVPEEAKDHMMHGEFSVDGQRFMLTDGMHGKVAQAGDNLAISLNYEDAQQAREVFEGLSEDGEIYIPFEEQFWGALFGNFRDRYGILWMINCETKKD